MGKVGVVFDLQFEALMNQRDLGKTLKQVMKCYSLNRRMENPMQLYMTSFTGRVEEDMSKNEGLKNWDMNFRTARYDAALPKDKIVYLSSESEQEGWWTTTPWASPLLACLLTSSST